MKSGFPFALSGWLPTERILGLQCFCRPNTKQLGIKTPVVVMLSYLSQRSRGSKRTVTQFRQARLLSRA